jgi:hypothetical protein
VRHPQNEVDGEPAGYSHAKFAEDGQQDLACIDPRSGATIEMDDKQDVAISSYSC